MNYAMVKSPLGEAMCLSVFRIDRARPNSLRHGSNFLADSLEVPPVRVPGGRTALLHFSVSSASKTKGGRNTETASHTHSSSLR